MPKLDQGAEARGPLVERLWADAVAGQLRRAESHPLDRRFGPPETWPGYYLAEASVRLRAKEIRPLLAEAVETTRVPSARADGAGSTIREKPFVGLGGKLVGRPDLIRDDEIVDYKTGAVIEFDEDAQAVVVKESYCRQLRIYGFLVKETLGWWPRRGWLLPVIGAAVEVALDPESCVREAAEAVALLDAYNRGLAEAADLRALATATPAACKWCPYKSICGAFWDTTEASWSGLLDGVAIEGTLLEDPRTIHSGRAFAIEVEVQAASETCEVAAIAPLEATVHGVLLPMRAGDQLRVVGLRARQDGSLTASRRTVSHLFSQSPPSYRRLSWPSSGALLGVSQGRAPAAAHSGIGPGTCMGC